VRGWLAEWRAAAISLAAPQPDHASLAAPLPSAP
jgi:hypothetical protein